MVATAFDRHIRYYYLPNAQSLSVYLSVLTARHAAPGCDSATGEPPMNERQDVPRHNIFSYLCDRYSSRRPVACVVGG
jgi:hypothetical protein